MTGKLMRLSSIVIATALSFMVFAGQAAHADANKQWKTAIVKKVASAHIYPRSAIRREIEGRAVVRVTVTRDGAVESYDIVEPAGERVLDKVIPKIMSKLSKLPAPPSEIPDNKLTFRIPLNWRLE